MTSSIFDHQIDGPSQFRKDTYSSYSRAFMGRGRRHVNGIIISQHGWKTMDMRQWTARRQSSWSAKVRSTLSMAFSSVGHPHIWWPNSVFHVVDSCVSSHLVANLLNKVISSLPVIENNRKRKRQYVAKQRKSEKDILFRLQVEDQKYLLMTGTESCTPAHCRKEFGLLYAILD